jgi:pantetheine-phosphate adenylyltransferase
MSQKTAIYPGTFDPLTYGHLSIIKRALKIFDKLVITILVNPNKTPLFSLEERVSMLNEIFKDTENIEVDTYNGMLIDYAVKKNINVVVRGLRALSDFEYEFQMALMNRKLNRDIQSVFLMTDYKWFYISSTIVKEAASYGGDIKGLVPPIVYAKLKQKFGFE